MWGHPVIRGHFLRRVSYLPHVKEPVTNGHLSCRDMFSGILRCPLKTGLLYAVYKPQSPQCSMYPTHGRRYYYLVFISTYVYHSVVKGFFDGPFLV